MVKRPRRKPVEIVAATLAVDGAWLQNQLDLIGHTQMSLALKLYPGQKNWLNKIVHGERRLQIDEAMWLADQFSVDADTLMSRFGYVPPARYVPVHGIAQRSGMVAPDNLSGAPAPPGSPPDMRALIVDEDCPALGVYKNTVLYYVPETGVKLRHTGRLCVIETGATGRLVWGRPELGDADRDSITTGADPILTDRMVSTSLIVWLKHWVRPA